MKNEAVRNCTSQYFFQNKKINKPSLADPASAWFCFSESSFIFHFFQGLGLGRE